MRSTSTRLKVPGRSVLDYPIVSEPRASLGRFFLRAEQLILDAGFTPRVVDMDVLNDINEANRRHWGPLIPPFNRNDLPGGPEVIALVCYNREGEAVAVTATRRYDLHGTDFLAEANSMRLYFGPRAEDAIKGHDFKLTAPSAAQITGDVTFIGAAWIRPDARGSGTFMLLPKLARYFTYSQARYDYETVFSIWRDAPSKLADAHAYEGVERGFTHRFEARDDAGFFGYISEAYLLRTLQRDVFACEESKSLDEYRRRKQELVAATRERH